MDAGTRERSPTAIVVAAALAVGALALVWLAGEAHYQGCIEQVTARYPPIAVSAFSGEETGPLKVAYDEERASALEDCGRAPW